MSAIFYKVIFKGTNQEETPQYSLTFKRIFSQKPIHIPSHYFSTLRNLSEKSGRITNFQNIQEVIKIGEAVEPYSFNYYIIIIFKTLSDEKMEGFLIGNAKKLGDLLIGVWPFNQATNYSSEITLEKLDELAKEKDLDKIGLIYS